MVDTNILGFTRCIHGFQWGKYILALGLLSIVATVASAKILTTIPMTFVGRDGINVIVLVPPKPTNSQLSDLVVAISCLHKRGKLQDLGIPPTTLGGNAGPYLDVAVYIFDEPKFAQIGNLTQWANADSSSKSFEAVSKEFANSVKAFYYNNLGEFKKNGNVGEASLGYSDIGNGKPSEHYSRLFLPKLAECPDVVLDGRQRQQADFATKQLADKTEGDTAFTKKYGAVPVRNVFDGTYRPVERYLKKTLSDPGSLDIEPCSAGVLKASDGWEVRCSYKARNALGGMMKDSRWFVIRNGDVVRTYLHK